MLGAFKTCRWASVPPSKNNVFKTLFYVDSFAIRNILAAVLSTTATQNLEERGDSYNGYQEEEESCRQEEEEVSKTKKLSMSSKLCPAVKRGIAFYRAFRGLFHRRLIARAKLGDK